MYLEQNVFPSQPTVPMYSLPCQQILGRRARPLPAEKTDRRPGLIRRETDLDNKKRHISSIATTASLHVHLSALMDRDAPHMPAIVSSGYPTKATHAFAQQRGIQDSLSLARNTPSRANEHKRWHARVEHKGSIIQEVTSEREVLPAKSISTFLPWYKRRSLEFLHKDQPIRTRLHVDQTI